MSHLTYVDFVRRAEEFRENNWPSVTSGSIDIGAVLAALRSSDSSLEGKSFSFTSGNTLAPTWLLQSKPDRTKCELLQAIEQRLSQLVTAEPAKPHFIDFTQLGNNRSDDGFQTDLINALVDMAGKVKAPVTIRYLEGNPAGKSADPLYFAKRLQSKTAGSGVLSHVKFYSANLDVPWVENYKDKAPGSWNHAKIFAIDGITSIVGGMNYWDDYLPGHNQVYDVAINVDGEVAGASHGFADYLWSDGVAKSGPNSYYHSFALGDTSFGSDLPPAFPASQFPPPSVPGSMPVLAVGNLGLWEDIDQASLLAEFLYSKAYEQVHPKNTIQEVMSANNVPLWFPFSRFDVSGNRARQASTTARHLTLGQVGAGGHIRISQQKIADTDLLPNEPYVLWPGDFLSDIVEALRRGAKVDILQSHYFGRLQGGYSDDVGPDGLVSVIAELLGSTPTGLEVRATQFNAEGQPANNHGKVWIANSDAYYVGSDNIYPAFLQEYGFVVADPTATAQFISDYWDPIWAAAKAS